MPTVHGFELSEEDARAFLVAANRAVELGGWDNERLAQLLIEISSSSGGFAGVGYDPSDLDQLLAKLNVRKASAARDPDDVGEAVGEGRVKLGDVWRLGDHRLVCGDARDPDVVREAVGEQLARLLCTDPPWGVNYEGKTSKRLTIANDDEAELGAFLLTSFGSVNRALVPGAPSISFIPPGRTPASSSTPSMAQAGSSSRASSG